MKICNKCGEEKELEMFSADCNRPDGYRAICKLCRNVQVKFRIKNPFIKPYAGETDKECSICKGIKLNKEFSKDGDGFRASCKECDRNKKGVEKRFNPYKGNTKHCSACKTYKPLNEFYSRNHKYVKHKSYCKKCQFYKEIKRRYGLTQTEYTKMLEEQNNSCGICNQVFDRTPHVDHKHEGTNRIRKLLCSNCNTGIGLFKDSPIVIENAIDYLNRGLVVPQNVSKQTLEKMQKEFKLSSVYDSRKSKNKRRNCSVETYLLLLLDLTCRICKDSIADKPCLDHCHKENKPRGLLCNKCNSGLGQFKDSVLFMKNAISYLQEYI